MINDCCNRELYIDTRSWYRKLWIYVTMRMRWNWPITRHIYQWYLIHCSKRFSKIMMPVIKNVVYSTFDVKEFVNVQPMNVPSGNVFYIDYIYTEKNKRWYYFWKWL